MSDERPRGDLFAGQDLRQLFCPAGRVFGRDHSQGDIVAVRQYRSQHRNGLRFIVLNTDQHFAGLQNMRKNANPSTTCAAQSCIRRSSAVMYGSHSAALMISVSILSPPP